MRRAALILMLACAATASCVYYNTLYNAKQAFKRAEQSQLAAAASRLRQDKWTHSRGAPPQEPSVSTADKNLYQTAIEKASKVVMLHPQSKYADDALWLIAKARYNQGEFVTAELGFAELIQKYPKSKYAVQAAYYLGMSQFWLKRYEQANETFTKIAEKKKGPYSDYAAFMVAYIDFIEKNYRSAILGFEDFLSRYRDSDSAASGYFFIGACHDSLKEYAQSLAAYERAAKMTKSHELYFDARFAYALAAYNADSVALGMRTFEDLAKMERYYRRQAQLRLKLAQGKRLVGDADAAVAEYLAIIEEFPNTDEVGEATYYLGLIHEDKNDLQTAKEYFTKATQVATNTTFRNLAVQRLAQIAKLETYRQKLQRNPPLGPSITPFPDSSAATSLSDSAVSPKSDARRDSAAAGGPVDSATIVLMTMGSDSLRSTTPIATTAEPTAPPPSDSADYSPTDTKTAVLDSTYLSSEDEDAALMRFLLAELYYHDLGRVDSALQEYRLVAEQHPNTSYAPRALLACAFISRTKGDTATERDYYQRIVQKYPASEQAAYAIRFLEGLTLPPEKDVERLYATAESLYFEADNLDSALALLHTITQNFPHTEYAAKSAFARAWLMSQNITSDTDSSAYYAFAEVVEKFPQTPYAAEAERKLGRNLPISTDTVTSSSGISPVDSSGQQPDTSALPQDTLGFAGNLPPAPPVKDSGHFIYPEHLLGQKLKGRVTFKIKLDFVGRVIEYEIIGPSGNTSIDSAATQALLSTTFDISRLQDLTRLSDYFRYDFRFAPPRLTEFYDPYQQRRERGP